MYINLVSEKNWNKIKDVFNYERNKKIVSKPSGNETEKSVLKKSVKSYEKERYLFRRDFSGNQ